MENHHYVTRVVVSLSNTRDILKVPNMISIRPHLCYE